MKSFKTPKGTELPIIQLQGKDYLNVQWRIVWMREEHSDWRIFSESVHFDGKSAMFRCTIQDHDGRVLSQAHKTSTDPKFPAERAETGALGRALALVGYGTQFCGDELEEGEEIADAPVERGYASSHTVAHQEKPRVSGGSQSFGDVVLKFGKDKGKKLKDIPYPELKGAADWARSKGIFPDIVHAIDAYLTSTESNVVPPPKDIAKLKSKMIAPEPDMFKQEDNRVPYPDDIPPF